MSKKKKKCAVSLNVEDFCLIVVCAYFSKAFNQSYCGTEFMLMCYEDIKVVNVIIS